LKITIEYDGYWFDYDVEYDDCKLMGTNRTLEGALEAVLESAHQIREIPRRTQRNS